MKKKSWRTESSEVPQEFDEEFRRKMAAQGIISIIWLGFFYALTAKTVAWAIFDHTLPWGPTLLAGVVTSFARAFDRFLTQ